MIHILVVEDSVQDMEFYKRTLQSLNEAQCFFAKTGEEALLVAQKEQIDMFLLDIELPGMNGLELARQIRSLPSYPLTLILFITGYADNQLAAFKQLHCYDYIVKPFDAVELRTKISELIRQLCIIKREPEKKERIFSYPSKRNDCLIPILSVKYATILRGNCSIYTDLQQEPFKSDMLNLTELIESMNDPYFIRCHRSFAVNVRRIRKFETVNYRAWRITLDQGEELDVTKKYFEQVRSRFNQWIQEKKV